MSDSYPDQANKSTAEFSRPLLLTPSQDFWGYLIGHLGRLLLFLITCASVLAVLFIFVFVIKEALPFFRMFSISEYLGHTGWYPEAGKPEFGMLAMIAGSVYVTIGSLLVAVPVGLLAAVYLSEMAPFKLRQICKPIIEVLAAIPSVAYGFFAFLVLAPWMQEKWGFSTGSNALNASIMLAVMALPTIISVSEDSLSAVGRELREASYGLGATRVETTFKVVIPAAHSGIIAGIILGMMRAIGETMVVWMASGNANQIPSPWWDLSKSIRTMTATIAGDMAEVARGDNHYRALFGVGFLLLAFTFVLNLLSEHFLGRVRESMRGGK